MPRVKAGSQEDHDRDQRDLKALTLLRNGGSQYAIAKKLGMNSGAVWQLWKAFQKETR